MQLSVKSLADNPTSLEVYTGSFITNADGKIHGKKGTPPDLQRLTLAWNHSGRRTKSGTQRSSLEVASVPPLTS